MDNRLIELKKELMDINFELDELNDNKLIKRYKSVLAKKKLLSEEIKDIYKEEKLKMFKDCNHLWISHVLDSEYCIKCGLSTVYNNLEYIDYDNLDYVNQVELDYLFNNAVNNGRFIDFEFDVDRELVRSIYLRLKTIYKKESDNTILKYLRASLYNITTKDKDEKNGVKRIKRLRERNEQNGLI